MDLYVYGYTDNQGWRGASASESMNKNQVLSEQRANSVSSYLRSNGISSAQMKEVKGFGESNPVASNDSSAGREQNRRVEVYVMPSKEMIKNAKAEAGEWCLHIVYNSRMEAALCVVSVFLDCEIL